MHVYIIYQLEEPKGAYQSREGLWYTHGKLAHRDLSLGIKRERVPIDEHGTE